MIRNLPIAAAWNHRRRGMLPACGPVAAVITKAAGVITAAGIALITAVLPAYAAPMRPSASGQPGGASEQPAGAGAGLASSIRPACPRARRGQARCLALYQPEAAVNRSIAAGMSGPAAQPQGWGPKAIESAYKLPVSRDPHQTVAIVDAQSTPHLAADLAVYRKHFGLPPCTTVTGCLRIVNQDGKTSPLPAPDPLGWGVEETLDVAMVSAACPHCEILVVEAKSPSFADLAAAENAATRLGAQVVSNSYGARESGSDQPYAKAYDHPGHTIVASSGDNGFTAASFPASLATVTAVGGTQLARAHNARGWREQVWNMPSSGIGSGSGCSAYAAKPAWQHDPHCPGRAVADVAAVAWNISIYDTSLRGNGGPWVTEGGTSASSPLIAGVYALAGNAAHIGPGFPYQHRTQLFDVTVGNNVIFGNPASACGGDYLCVAKPGYDAPTGLGAPEGTGAF